MKPAPWGPITILQFLKTEINYDINQIYYLEEKVKSFFSILETEKEKKTIINFLNFLLKK